MFGFSHIDWFEDGLTFGFFATVLWLAKVFAFLGAFALVALALGAIL